MVWLPHGRYDAEFEAETKRFASAVSELQPETPLPTCPEWTVRDLVTHVGTGHRWATAIVDGRTPTPPPYVTTPAPQDPSAWADWLTTGARRLADAIHDAGSDGPVWTWRPEDQTAGFWLRKMVHDELIHRYDAEIALGRLGDVAPDLAADGVSDLLATITTLSRPDSPDPIFAALVGTGETIRFRATDRETGDWLVERSPAGVRWRQAVNEPTANEPTADERPAAAEPDVTIQAPVRELLLLLNRRLDLAEPGVEITGDRALFAHWLDHSQF